MVFVWVSLGIVLVSLLLYWLLVIAEGTYLGPRIVTLLYDWTAGRYDAIKKLEFVNESYFLGAPFANRLAEVGGHRVLDIAAGTGRIASALRKGGAFAGQIVSLDRSDKMLQAGRLALTEEDVACQWVLGDAHALPFADGSFDGVSCTEAHEFFGDPAKAHREAYRVLRPGGVLLTTNRVGPEAALMPRRHAGRGRVESLLAEIGYCEIDSRRWQVHYDLIWAQKPTFGEKDGTSNAQEPD